MKLIDKTVTTLSRREFAILIIIIFILKYKIVIGGLKNFFRPEESPRFYRTGHYSQVVWGATTSIGCGASAFDKPSIDSTMIVYLVCNYGPSGNFVGEEYYERSN